MPLASAQLHFSLLSRDPEQLATQAACRQLGITLIAYSLLGPGMHTAANQILIHYAIRFIPGATYPSSSSPDLAHIKMKGKRNLSWDLCCRQSLGIVVLYHVELYYPLYNMVFQQSLVVKIACSSTPQLHAREPAMPGELYSWCTLYQHIHTPVARRYADRQVQLRAATPRASRTAVLSNPTRHRIPARPRGIDCCSAGKTASQASNAPRQKMTL